MEVTLKQAGEIILKAKNIVLSSHVNPDGDNVGSTLGLYHALKGTGKNIKILLDDDLPDNLGMMKGLDLYQKPDKKLEGIDLMVILDVDIDRIGKVRDVVDAPVLNIDHHISNSKVCDFCYVDANAAATAQIVYSLIKEMGMDFNVDSATCLYTGLVSDTGFFRYSNTTPYTLRAAAELLEAGARPDKISEIFDQRSFSSVKAAGRAISTIDLYHDGKIALMTVDKALKESADNTEGFVNFARNIRGVDVAVMIKYADENVTRVSMRSKNTNVSEVAQSIGGGGHIRAAGATVYKNLSQAKEIVLNAIIEGMKKQNA
ncbi:DHH family phosphoesterase [Megamonas hypermegale]|uniref:DHH family phosphoesterase n=1 Tax=Megamonas hypermegale TaxID=158847 RepID=UPI00320B7788